jgi:hypothetical protein
LDAHGVVLEGRRYRGFLDRDLFDGIWVMASLKATPDKSLSRQLNFCAKNGIVRTEL